MSKEFVSQEYEVAQAGADVKEGTLGSRILKMISSSALIVTIVVSISLVAFTITFFLSEVEGPSMMQTVNADFTWNDMVYDNVVVNRYATAKRGDIIVVKYHDPAKDKDKYLIKRLIATGGDKIRFTPNTGNDGTYKMEICYAGSTQWKDVDEWYLDEYWGVMALYGKHIYQYIETGTRPPIQYTFYPFEQNIVRASVEGSYILIPKGDIFYMGDNRGSSNDNSYDLYHSHDCTAYGPQPAKYIEGVVADIIKEKEPIPSYVFRKVTDFILLKWIFG